MGRALSPLSEIIPRVAGEAARNQALQYAGDTATPDLARRLGESWRMFPGVSPDTHLAFALSEIEVTDPIWALHQAVSAQMEAEDWGVAHPISERQNADLDTMLARGRESRGIR